MKKISVVIVTYNSESDIYACLEALYTYNDIGTDLEVIVVDNNSKQQEELFVHLRQYNKEIVCIPCRENLGYGAGNNIGIKASSAPFVTIMNPDVRLVQPVFRELLEIFENQKADLVGMRQYETPHRPGQSFLMLFLSVPNLFVHKICSLLNVYIKSRFCFSGACFAFRKTSLEEFGGFDEKMFLYGEERYIHLQLLRHGRDRIYYAKKLRYLHPVHDRAYSGNTMKLGFLSYKYVIHKLGLNYPVLLRKLMNMYRFLSLKAKLTGDTTGVEEQNQTLQMINQNK